MGTVSEAELLAMQNQSNGMGDISQEINNVSNKPEEVNGVVKGTVYKQPTPEEALAIYETNQLKQTDEDKLVNGVKEVAEEVKEVKKPSDADDKGELTLEEQLAQIKADIAERDGIKPEAKNSFEAVEKHAEEKGIIIEDYAKAYITNGELSEEQYISLKESGFDKTAVDTYITGKTSEANANSNAMIEGICGNQDNFAKMSEWMTSEKGISNEELDMYNTNVQGNLGAVFLENMYSKYQLANPKPARMIRGQGNQFHGEESTYTMSDMHNDMANPRYRTDPAFKQKVIKKVATMS